MRGSSGPGACSTRVIVAPAGRRRSLFPRDSALAARAPLGYHLALLLGGRAMPRRVRVGRAALLTALLLAGPARADLLCPQPVVDVGEVRAGAPLTRRFDFRNAGALAVEITDAVPSCGCLRPE